MILAFTEYHGPEVSAKTGKTIPPKAKAGTEWYTFARQLDPTAVRDRLNTPAECTVEVSQNGKFTNRILTSVTFIEAAGPESPTIQTSTPTPTSQPVTRRPADSPQKIAPHAMDFDAARQRLIVRQSCLKAAVEHYSNREISPLDVLDLADMFVHWVFKEEAYGLSENHEGGGGTRGGDRDVTPSPLTTQQSYENSILPNHPRPLGSQITPAERALETARQKSADIRAGYVDEDAVCPSCGRKEWLKQWDGGWFCSKKEGGCGFPPKGERLDFPMTYGEWKQRTETTHLRRPDAPVVGPGTHPTR